jgi:hypothetical protein
MESTELRSAKQQATASLGFPPHDAGHAREERRAMCSFAVQTGRHPVFYGAQGCDRQRRPREQERLYAIGSPCGAH